MTDESQDIAELEHDEQDQDNLEREYTFMSSPTRNNDSKLSDGTESPADSDGGQPKPRLSATPSNTSPQSFKEYDQKVIYIVLYANISYPRNILYNFGNCVAIYPSSAY